MWMRQALSAGRRYFQNGTRRRHNAYTAYSPALDKVVNIDLIEGWTASCSDTARRIDEAGF